MESSRSRERSPRRTTPPFVQATQGHAAGYKLFVSDLPHRPFAELSRWALAILAGARCQAPVDLESSDRVRMGRPFLLLTFADAADARRARELLHGQPVEGGRTHAKFWEPRPLSAAPA